ncbi:FAD-dependent oxidoreductase, partial [Nocardioides sp.]|uniref:FAD-dependent oxidoreductase n=1 Tax=Nocardioides sp. TaxID=35761 RepID=UPI002ED318B4
YEAHPRQRVHAWSASTYDTLVDLAAEPRTGVRLRSGTEVLRESLPDPRWSATVPDLTRVTPPSGYVDAWSFTAPVADMPVYLRWLQARLEELGGTVTRVSMADLPRPAEGVVVNCAGLGARRLVDETDVHPARGQVLVVAGARVDRWWLDESGPTYVVPRGDQVVVGGTFEEDDWSRTPDPATAERIWKRAVALVPALASGEVVAHRVGLRPVRSEVRLERIGDVIHCYGHGGAGVTLSWGCADEVASLVEA